MSLSNFLHPDEEVLFHIKIKHEKEKIIREDNLGYTQKRVYHFRKLKGRNRIYRDIPIGEVSYLESGWHDTNRKRLIAGIVCLILGICLVIFTFGILIVMGIVLIVQARRQYGYLIINSELWEFDFSKRKDIAKIEEFIRNVYFAIEHQPDFSETAYQRATATPTNYSAPVVTAASQNYFGLGESQSDNNYQQSQPVNEQESFSSELDFEEPQIQSEFVKAILAEAGLKKMPDFPKNKDVGKGIWDDIDLKGVIEKEPEPEIYFEEEAQPIIEEFDIEHLKSSIKQSVTHVEKPKPKKPTLQFDDDDDFELEISDIDKTALEGELLQMISSEREKDISVREVERKFVKFEESKPDVFDEEIEPEGKLSYKIDGENVVCNACGFRAVIDAKSCPLCGSEFKILGKD